MPTNQGSPAAPWLSGCDTAIETRVPVERRGAHTLESKGLETQ
jgi:hypothetical protein